MSNWAASDPAIYQGDAYTVFAADNANQRCWIRRNSDNFDQIVQNDLLIYPNITYSVGDYIVNYPAGPGPYTSYYQCLAIEGPRTWLIVVAGGSGSPFHDHSRSWDLKP